MSKNIFVWLIVGVLLFSLIDAFQSTSMSKNGTVMAYSEFTQQVQEGKVHEVVLQGGKIAGICTYYSKEFFCHESQVMTVFI